jgi:predicted AAA+ superfamily ATPase
MDIPREALVAVLAQFNPWWRGDTAPDVPAWKRTAFAELSEWIVKPPAPRAVLLSGARQTGKTTLLLQSIRMLLSRGVPPADIVYATFDHPLLKQAGVEAVLDAWREREPAAGRQEYLFLDEAQFVRDWDTWLKLQVDFNKHRRIVFTGSAMPLAGPGQESGVGRLYTVQLPTLSFYEYIRLRQISLPELPGLDGLDDLFGWETRDFHRCREGCGQYTGHFHEYLLRGGFPQIAVVENITLAQQLLREDIIDRILKRDMTALFGVRRVPDLEHTFLYLCLHDGGLLDMPNLCANLEVTRPTAQNFLELLEAAHLIYRLPPYGYGKEILRGRFKIYLADASIAPAVMLKGKSLPDDAASLAAAAETAVFKHLYTRRHARNTRFSIGAAKNSTRWTSLRKRKADARLLRSSTAAGSAGLRT